MGTPLAFQATCVSTVVAAHWMDLEARARWRSFCGIILISTSRPFFLKMPALSARVSGAKPVQPDMPSTILVSCARAGAASAITHAVAAASDVHFATDRVIICSCVKKVRWPTQPGRLRAGCHDDSRSIPVYTGETLGPHHVRR